MGKQSVSERLLVRLRAEGWSYDLPEGTVLRRGNASRSARSAGAWAWFAMNENKNVHLGSEWSMRSLLEASRLTFHTDAAGGIHIEPDN